MPCRWSPTARTSSISAASPRGLARRRCPPTKNGAASRRCSRGFARRVDRADFDRHLQGRGRRARDRSRRGHRQRHFGAGVRPGAGRRGRAPKRGRRADAQPRAVARDVRRGRLRGCGRRRRPPNWPRACGRRRPPASRAIASSSIPAWASRSARSTASRCLAGLAATRRTRISAAVRPVAEVIPESRSGRRAARPSASGAPPPPSRPRSCSARTSFASTT